MNTSDTGPIYGINKVRKLQSGNLSLPKVSRIDYANATEEQRSAWDAYNKNLSNYNYNLNSLSTMPNVRKENNDYIFPIKGNENWMDLKGNDYASYANAGNRENYHIRLPEKPMYSGPELFKQNASTVAPTTNPVAIATSQELAHKPKIEKGVWVQNPDMYKKTIVKNGIEISNPSYGKKMVLIGQSIPDVKNYVAENSSVYKGGGIFSDNKEKY